MNEYFITPFHVVFLVLQIIILQLISSDYVTANKAGQLGELKQHKGSEMYLDLAVLGTFVFHVFLWSQDFDTSRKAVMLFSTVALMLSYFIFGMLAVRALGFRKKNRQFLLFIKEKN